jgi:thiosulfate reductase cytochrome b subunit
MAFSRMWILAINGIAYLIYGLVSGRFRRMLLPIRLRELIATVRDALRLHLAHDDLTRYNAVQRTLYLGIILVGILQVISGLVVWKPMQFSELTTFFYDFQGAARFPRSYSSTSAFRQPDSDTHPRR